MARILALLLCLCPGPLLAAQLCVTNGSAARLFFTAEIRGEARRAAWLDPGQSLCVSGASRLGGTVGAFPDADVFEGCSRLVPPGGSETLLAYDAVDRCDWASFHKGRFPRILN